MFLMVSDGSICLYNGILLEPNLTPIETKKMYTDVNITTHGDHQNHINMQSSKHRTSEMFTDETIRTYIVTNRIPSTPI